MVVEGYYQFGGMVGKEMLGSVQVVAVLETDARSSLTVINSVLIQHANLLDYVSDEIVPTDASPD